MTLGEAIDKVRDHIGKNSTGKCYVATEAVYYLAGGKEAGLKPMRMKVPVEDDGYEQITHWFLRGPNGEVIDLTAGQFKRIPDYSTAIGSGFMTKHPSSMASELMGASG